MIGPSGSWVATLRGIYYDKKENIYSFIKNLQILFWVTFARNYLNCGDFRTFSERVFN